MPTRYLPDHAVHHSPSNLQVTSEDEPGHGGAHHHYKIGHTSAVDEHGWSQHIMFQNGTIPEAGVNGVTHEALLAVVIDRLRSFQAGPFACRENALALTNLEQSLMWLQKRTRDRIARNVEGTHAK